MHTGKCLVVGPTPSLSNVYLGCIDRALCSSQVILCLFNGNTKQSKAAATV